MSDFLIYAAVFLATLLLLAFVFFFQEPMERAPEQDIFEDEPGYNPMISREAEDGY